MSMSKRFHLSNKFEELALFWDSPYMVKSKGRPSGTVQELWGPRDTWILTLTKDFQYFHQLFGDWESHNLQPALRKCWCLSNVMVWPISQIFPPCFVNWVCHKVLLPGWVVSAWVFEDILTAIVDCCRGTSRGLVQRYFNQKVLTPNGSRGTRGANLNHLFALPLQSFVASFRGNSYPPSRLVWLGYNFDRSLPRDNFES